MSVLGNVSFKNSHFDNDWGEKFLRLTNING